MAEKKFYWLKLQGDFFKSKRIKKLRRLAGGDTYTIIYLKMQLLAMENNGVLVYTGLEKTFAEELALELDEEPDNVCVTVNYLLNCGLLETSGESEYIVPYAILNTGSETSAAKRMREMRERNIVTPALPERYTEKEKEKEKEITVSKETVSSTDVLRIVEAWNTLGLSKVSKIVPGTNRHTQLHKRIKDYGVESILTAIENVRNSVFLNGQNKKGWIITFDWFVKPNNFVKVLEGNYADNPAEGKSIGGVRKAIVPEKDTEAAIRESMSDMERYLKKMREDNDPELQDRFASLKRRREE